MLSVVMTIVDGVGALDENLKALHAQVGAPEMQILVPYDDSVHGIEALKDRYPTVEFLPMGHVPTEYPVTNAAGAHELYDRRRAVGLKAATGELIAILEDRGVPRPDWAAGFARLHAERPEVSVIGGAVECGIDDPLAWAVYFCDFGRYQLPFEGASVEYVTDVNICYKRAALERTRHLWEERYHETLVNWTLREQGETLFLTPDVVIDEQLRNRDLQRLVSERFHWGRLFAYTRVRRAQPLERVKFLAGTPVLPAMLLARHGRVQWQKRKRLGRFVQVAPLVGALLVPWCAGELVGYATGKA